MYEEVSSKASKDEVLKDETIFFEIKPGTNLVDVFGDEMDGYIPNYNDGIRQTTEHAAYKATQGFIAVDEGAKFHVNTATSHYISTIACYDKDFRYLKSKSLIGINGITDEDFTIQEGVSYIIITLLNTTLYKNILVKSGRCYVVGERAMREISKTSFSNIPQFYNDTQKAAIRNNIKAADADDVTSLLNVNFDARNVISVLQHKAEEALAKSYPLHYIDLMQRINDRYDFGNITLSSSFVVPTSGNVQIEVSDATKILVNSKIAIGTIDYYDVYNVVNKGGNIITANMDVDNLGMKGKTIPVSTQMNITSGSADLNESTRVFLYEDILSYKANEMPYTLRGGDTVHSNDAGFQYVADIIKESILSRYTEPRRIFAFGDSWTAMETA